MNSRVRLLRFLTVLCAVALLGAQIFGMAHGYVCACSGAPEWTVEDHCHGPHDASCHQQDAPAHEENSDAGPRQEHREVRGEVQTRLVEMPLAAPELVPLLVLFFGSECAVPTSMEMRRADFRRDGASESPPGIAIARTTVLLI